MKRIVLLVASIFGLLLTNTVHAVWTSTNALLIQIQMTGLIQTNNTGTTVTNAAGVTTSTVTAKPIVLTTKDLLKMLAVEFNTNFPTGAQLALDAFGLGFVVTDANGNFLLDVSSNPNNSSYICALSNAISGDYLNLQYGKIIENHALTNGVANVTQIYRHYGFFYKDSHGNDFNFIGNITAKYVLVESAQALIYKSFTINMPGAGGGTITRNGVPGVAMFSRATLVGAGRNLTPNY